MRNFLLPFFLLFSAAAAGQSKSKFSIFLHVDPELIVHEDSYSFSGRESTNKYSISLGGGTGLQYNFSSRIFVDIGINYVSRILNTMAAFDHSSIPPPRQSATQELVITKKISLRTIVVPLNIGYRMKIKAASSLFVFAGMAGNYLLNTDYGFSGRYGGSYGKKFWQGYSVNLGVGGDQKLAKNLSLSGRVGYSVVNTVKEDDYLSNPGPDGIWLNHNVLNFGLGIKLAFRNLIAR